MRNKCFKLKYIRSLSDATCDYELIFEKPCTLRQFVKDVVSNKKEWGEIGIASEDPFKVFGDPYIKYKHGELLSTFPDELLDKQIDINVKHRANGGWSLMTYIVKLEDEDEV